MPAAKKTQMLVIEHLESAHREEVTQDFWDNELQPAIKAKYKIADSSEISTPDELIEYPAN